MDDETPSRHALRQQRYRERKRRRKQRNQSYWQRNKKRLIQRRSKRPAYYAALVMALVARRKQLGWTQAELDARAGWQEGYCSHLERWTASHGRIAGLMSLALWVQALGIGELDVKHLPTPERRSPSDERSA